MSKVAKLYIWDWSNSIWINIMLLLFNAWNCLKWEVSIDSSRGWPRFPSDCQSFSKRRKHGHLMTLTNMVQYGLEYKSNIDTILVIIKLTCHSTGCLCLSPAEVTSGWLDCVPNAIMFCSCHPPSEPLLTESLAMAEASAFYETYFVKSVSYIAFQVGEIFCLESYSGWMTKVSFLLMTSFNEYLNSVGKVKCFLVWSQGNACTQWSQFHYINNFWKKKQKTKTCLHKHIANCK